MTETPQENPDKKDIFQHLKVLVKSGRDEYYKASFSNSNLGTDLRLQAQESTIQFPHHFDYKKSYSLGEIANSLNKKMVEQRSKHAGELELFLDFKVDKLR